MKATKIVGAILGVLMVAALFTGAVAASSSEDYSADLGDIYINMVYDEDDLHYKIQQLNDARNESSNKTLPLIPDISEKFSQYLTGWKMVGSPSDTVSFSLDYGSYYDGGAYIGEAVSEAEDSKIQGTYYKTINGWTYYINVVYPTVDINGYILTKDLGEIEEEGYLYEYIVGNLVDGTINTDQSAVLFVNSADTLKTGLYGFALINPDGSRKEIISRKELAKIKENGFYPLNNSRIKADDLGVWTIKPVFIKNYYYASTAPTYMYGKGVTYTLISADTTKSLTPAVDDVTQGGLATITLKAPYGDYLVKVDDEATIPNGQENVRDTDYYKNGDSEFPLFNEPGTVAIVSVGSSGSQSFVVKSLTTNDFKVTLYDTNGTIDDIEIKYDDGTLNVKKEITVKVKAGAISATPEKESIYIGDEVKITGTNDLGGNVYFFIKGTNYKLEPILNKDVKSYDKEKGEASDLLNGAGKIWEATIDTAYLNNPDAGVYTIYVVNPNTKYTSQIPMSQLWDLTTDVFDNTSLVNAYTTISISLIQPFITAKVNSDVVVQGDKLEVEGSAEGNPTSIMLYVFGTNFFKNTTVSVIDGKYTFSKKIVSVDSDDTTAWPMATGQYFLVAQHPMYDGKFNIGPLDASNSTLAALLGTSAKAGYNIVLNESGSYDAILKSMNPRSFELALLSNSKVIFNTNERQSSNAAQALIDAIGSQNIDDMQAHLSFIVAGPTSYVNAIPSQVTKGQTLTISGTTTGHYNEVVSVELLSTAFAAVPKETVGSAAFATVTTRIGEDGVWSVSFDTTNLNADDYTVSIAVGQLDPVTGKTKIVAGSGTTPTVTPTSQPTVSPTTVQPTTTPKTPGFGALAALVGLGAVAVLLLRRE